MTVRKVKLGLLIPGLTIAVFAILLVTSLIRLSAIEKDMRIEATQNMLWVVSRAQTGSLKLQIAVSQLIGGHSDIVDVERQLNNFLSHYNVLNHGPQRRQMEEMGFAEALDRLEVEKEELQQTIPALSVGDRHTLARIYATLGPFDAMLARAANKAMVAEWESLGGKLENSRQQIAFIIGSLFAIALAGAGMAFHLIMASRSAAARARLLEREKAFSQLLVTSSSEAIIAVDQDGRCTLWNDAATAVFGFSVKSISLLADVSGFFGTERIEKAVSNAASGRPAVLSDIPFFRSVTEAPIYLDVRCFPLRDGTNIIGSIMLISDVTEQYEARRQLSERRDYLEEQVLLRTQELNAALARERAATDIYRNFAAMVSHQFRTPLAIVDSNLQRLKRRASRLTTVEIVERAGQARAGISRLVSLIESTLDVARLDNGQIDYQTQPWDLHRSITDAMRQQSEETPDRNFRYENSGPVILHCDPIHTEHVIVNLLSNAAKYAAPGTDIHIEQVRRGQQAGCRVINQGFIDTDDQQYLFERYFRAGNSREKNGVGIGLYMARSLARLQKGDVYFESIGDDSIAFTLLLPVVKEGSAAMGSFAAQGRNP